MAGSYPNTNHERRIVLTASNANEKLQRYCTHTLQDYSYWGYMWHMLFLHIVVRLVTLTQYRVHYIGREHIPRKGRYIVASNHISSVDPPILSLGIGHPIAYMAKRELFERPLLAPLYYSLGAFMVDRDNPSRKTIQTALTVFKSHLPWCLGLFPEGTRNTSGEILPLKQGVGALAAKLACPVLPVGIRREGKTFYCQFGPVITNVTDVEAFHSHLYNEFIRLSQPINPECV